MTILWLQGALVSGVRVLIADRERAFAQALAFRLSQEASMDVLGSVYSCATAEAELARSHPDVLVLADTLDEDVYALTARVGTRATPLRIVAMVSSQDPELASSLIRAGACAVVVKDGSMDEVIMAVEGAARYESYIPPRLLAGVLDELCTEMRHSDEEERLARLTPRERDVLACMMAGLNRAGIADRMVLSTNTVRTHAQGVFAKLDVHSTLEAVGVALRAGFTERPRRPEGPAASRAQPKGVSSPVRSAVPAPGRSDAPRVVSPCPSDRPRR